MNLPDVRYTSGSIKEYFSRINDATSLEVMNALQHQRSSQVGWIKVLFIPAGYFVRRYFFSRDYRKGLHGLIDVVCESIAVLVFVAKLWEYRMAKGEHLPKLPPVTSSDLENVRQW